MDPNPELNDEQLDALLGNLEVPADLKDQLRKITSSNSGVIVLHTKSQQTWINGRMLAIAATLLAVAGFLSWSWITAPNAVAPSVVKGKTNPEGIGDVKEPGKVEAEKKEEDGNGKRPSDANSRLANATDSNPADLESRHQDQIDALMQDIELQNLRYRLAKLESTSSSYLPPNEYESIVQVVAHRSSLELGGDESRIRNEMLSVISQYPETRGAELAQQYVNNTQNN